MKKAESRIEGTVKVLEEDGLAVHGIDGYVLSATVAGLTRRDGLRMTRTI